MTDPTPGDHLRSFREAAGISQSELARRSGLSQPHISQMEAGTRPLTAWAATCVELALDLEPRSLVRHADDVPTSLLETLPG